LREAATALLAVPFLALVLAMVIIGGAGLGGAAAGALFLTWATQSVQNLGKYSLLAQAILFLVIIYALPGGLRQLYELIERSVFRRVPPGVEQTAGVGGPRVAAGLDSAGDEL